MAEFEFLGPYRVGKLLGRGGMGNVYHGKHVKSGEQVAVKVIASAVADEPRFRRRFDKEIKTLKMLRHPGIVRLVGFGEQEGQLFYSMELVDGETLQEMIRREGKVGWQLVLRYAIQICAALKHAHDIGVTHRDLKPANLIRTPHDEIKLVDFGIPKVFGDLSEQTAAGSMLGTPDYMAPEQANGDPITARTDLYALGSVMYALLTGRAPFRGKNATAVIKSLTHDKPVPLDMLDVELPTKLGELVHQLLEKEEKDRPRTALMVSNRLKAMQMALASDQTVVGGAPQTSVGENPLVAIPRDPPHATDHGTRLERDPTTRDPGTPAPGTPAPGKQLGTGNKTVAGTGTIVTRGGQSASTQQEQPAADIRTIVSDIDAKSFNDRDAASSAPVRRGGSTKPSDRCVNADDEQDLANQPESTTHFSTVNESEIGTGVFDFGVDAGKSKLQVWGAMLSLAAMLGVLVIGAALFYQAVQPPSADQLYEQATSGNSASASTFLRRFPGDDRFSEVKRVQVNRKLEATLNRLTAKSKIGLRKMSPMESAFLLCFQDRETRPAAAADSLTQWLSLFEEQPPGSDSPNDETASLRQNMIEIAKFMQAELASAVPQSSMDQRAMEWIDKVKSAMNLEDPAVKKSKLQAIVDMFGGEQWAQPAVNEATLRLKELE